MSMTEFELDCLQKKIIGRNARNKVGLRRSVRLPSDSLNSAELQRRNGPVRVYCMGKPMAMGQFEGMPADLQRAYLRRLRRSGGSREAVGRMLGVSRARVRALEERHRVRFDRPDEGAWKAFLSEMASEEAR